MANIDISTTNVVTYNKPYHSSLGIVSLVSSIIIVFMYIVIFAVIGDMNANVYKYDFYKDDYVFSQANYDAMMDYIRFAIPISLAATLFIAIPPIFTTRSLIKENKKHSKLLWMGYLAIVPFVNIFTSIFLIVFCKNNEMINPKLKREKANLAKDYSHITSETINQYKSDQPTNNLPNNNNSNVDIKITINGKEVDSSKIITDGNKITIDNSNNNQSNSKLSEIVDQLGKK